jgi:hypothetical protein
LQTELELTIVEPFQDLTLRVGLSALPINIRPNV